MRSCNAKGIRLLLASRLRDTRGFMIAEQLISIIFIGLLCIAVAAGLGAAMSSYSRITAQTQADALLSQAVEQVSDELVYALDVKAGKNGVVDDPLFVSSTQRIEAGFVSEQRGIWMSFPSSSGKQPVLFVAAQDGLVPQLANLSYDADAGTWSFRIAIQSGGSTLADATMTVKRIGS